MNGALRVKQLIEELKKRDPESVVQVWDPYNDRETDEVYVSDMRDGATMLSNTNFGTANPGHQEATHLVRRTLDGVVGTLN